MPRFFTTLLCVAGLAGFLVSKPAAAAGLAASPRPRQQGPAAPGKALASTQPAALAGAFGTAAPGAAPAPATPQVVRLRGVVWLPGGQPCAGASVYPAGAPRQLVVTDAKGNFTLPVPAGGPASLRIEYFGVGSSRVEVPVPSGADLLHITLGQ